MHTDAPGRRTLSLDNGVLRLEVLADAGPRIVRLQLEGSDENLLAETPDLGWKTPWGDYRLLGGHRLWHAPEDPPWTSIPDHEGGLTVVELQHGLRLERLEEPIGLRKSIEVELPARGSEVTMRHVVRNEGERLRVLAPWAITMLPLHGTAILPQQVGTCPRRPARANRALALWPGSSWSDERLELGDDLVLVRGEPGAPFKVGQLEMRGWVAYLRGGVLLSKHVERRRPRSRVDFCNVEVYCNDRFLELETLGPLTELAPGMEVSHEERWRLDRVDVAEPSRARLAALVAELGLG